MNTKNAKKSSKKSNTSPAVIAPVTPVAATSKAAAPTPPPLTAADVAQCQSLLSQVDGILGPVTQLSADDIRRSLKLRKGGAQVVTALVALCNHHGVTAVGPVTTDSMSTQMAQANLYSEIGVKFAAVGKKLSDATFSAESFTWQQATALYTVLQRLSLMDPTLEQGMQPLVAFFQTKVTKGKKRVNADNRQLANAEKLAGNRAPSTGGAAAPPAPVTTGTATGTTSGASAASPVVATPAATSGVAHA